MDRVLFKAWSIATHLPQPLVTVIQGVVGVSTEEGEGPLWEPQMAGAACVLGEIQCQDSANPTSESWSRTGSRGGRVKGQRIVCPALPPQGCYVAVGHAFSLCE